MVSQKMCKKITNTFVPASSVSKDEKWGSNNRSVAQYPVGIVFGLLANAAPSRSMFLRNILNFDNFDFKDLRALNTCINEGVHKSWCGPSVLYDASVWINSAVLQLNTDFPGRTKHHFKLNINLVDYKERNIKNEVNQIVQKKTNNKVKKLLPDEPGADIGPSTLVFESCFYFHGYWNQKFETRTGTFRTLYQGPVTAQFLTTKNKQYIREGIYSYSYPKDPNPRTARFQVLSLPYKSGNDSRRFSMLVLLPNEADFPNNRADALPYLMDALAAKEHTFLDDHFPTEEVEVGDFRLPTFTLGEADKMDKIVTAFACPPYDLTGMVKPAPKGPLHVNVSANPRRNNSSVGYAQCFMKIDQNGTELAGANAILVQETPTGSLTPGKQRLGSPGMDPGLVSRPGLGSGLGPGSVRMSAQSKVKTDFVADHPFLCFIRENGQRFVGAAGFVVNPTLPPQQI